MCCTSRESLLSCINWYPHSSKNRKRIFSCMHFVLVEIPFSKLNLLMETVEYFKMSSIDIHCRSILLKLLHNIAFYRTGASLASSISWRWCNWSVILISEFLFWNIDSTKHKWRSASGVLWSAKMTLVLDWKSFPFVGRCQSSKWFIKKEHEHKSWTEMELFFLYVVITMTLLICRTITCTG